jgi:hypothetical protein
MGHVFDPSVDREFYMEQEKTYFWGSKRRKLAFRAQYFRVIDPTIGNFTWSKKKYNVKGQKGKNRPQKQNLGSKISMIVMI